MRQLSWYKLDNIGKFYSALSSKQVQNVFRFSVTLKEKVDENCLQKAVDHTLLLFPSFHVHLRKGFFWYYLDESDRKYEVGEENLPICFRLYNNRRDFLFRISYYKRRINFEVSHILSDGRGSIEFFKILIEYYLKEKYHLKKTVTSPSSYQEKEEDSFEKYYRKVHLRDLKPKNKTKIYRYHGRKMNQTRYLEVHMPVSKVLEKAHEYDCSLTTFLSSVLIFSFAPLMSENDLKKMVKIDIPVDLRPYFPSFSSKNYFGLASIEYCFAKRDDDLQKITEIVRSELQEKLTAKSLSVRVNQMVSFEKNPFCRVAPLGVKNLVLRIIDAVVAGKSTTTISNLGKIDFGDSFDSYIENVNVLTSTQGFQMTICSFQNNLSIGIASRYKYHDGIRNFCNYFSNCGIPVTINVSEVK